MNLAADLLETLSLIPGLQIAIPEKLRLQYPAVFGDAETRFRDMRGKLVVRDGLVLVDNLRLVAKDYSLRAVGSISLDAVADLRSSFVASQALTESLVAEVKAMRYLRNSDGRVEIPFRQAGDLPEGLRPIPDKEYLLKQVAVPAAADYLGSILSKKKSAGSQGQSDPASGDSSKQPEVEPADVVEDVLRGIFGR